MTVNTQEASAYVTYLFRLERLCCRE